MSGLPETDMVRPVRTVCPECHGELARDESRDLKCLQCGALYPERAEVDVFLTEAEWNDCLLKLDRHEESFEQYSHTRRQSLLTSLYYDMWASRILEQLPDQFTGPLLESMAGGCEITRRLPARIQIAVALDRNVRSIEGAARTFAAAGETRIQAICGTVERLPFPDESFGAVVVQGGLHHIRPHLGQVLSEIYRVLTPRGIFVGSEPADDCWITERIRKFQYRTSKYQGYDAGESGFTESGLKKDMANAGLELESYRRLGFIAYPLMCNLDLLPVLGPFQWHSLGQTLLSLDALMERMPGIRELAWINLFRARKLQFPEDAC